MSMRLGLFITILFSYFLVIASEIDPEVLKELKENSRQKLLGVKAPENFNKEEHLGNNLYSYFFRLPGFDFNKKSKQNLDDYFNLYSKLGLHIEYSMKDTYLEYPKHYSAYFRRINITKLDEFRKIGIDLIEMSKNYFHPKNHNEEIRIKEEILVNPAIIIGTIVDSISPLNSFYESLFDKYQGYNTKYVVRIDEFLKGDYYFTQKDKEVIYYSSNGYYYKRGIKKYSKNPIFPSDDNLILHKKCVIFLDKSNDYEVSRIYGKAVFDLNGNLIKDIEKYKGENNNNLIDYNLMTSNLYYSDLNGAPTIYTVENNKLKSFGRLVMQLDKLRQLVKEIETINDTKNFYNRSYK